MNAEIQQAGQEILRPIAAAGASSATALTGISTYFQWIPPTLGSIASFMGIIVTIQLYRNYRLKWRLMKLELEQKQGDNK